jgi:hypothetical protein
MQCNPSFLFLVSALPSLHSLISLSFVSPTEQNFSSCSSLYISGLGQSQTGFQDESSNRERICTIWGDGKVKS